MPNKAKPIPEGYHTVTPYLIVDGGVAALDFYKKASVQRNCSAFQYAELPPRARRNQDR